MQSCWSLAQSTVWFCHSVDIPSLHCTALFLGRLQHHRRGGIFSQICNDKIRPLLTIKLLFDCCSNSLQTMGLRKKTVLIPLNPRLHPQDLDYWPQSLCLWRHFSHHSSPGSNLNHWWTKLNIFSYSVWLCLAVITFFMWWLTYNIIIQH